MAVLSPAKIAAYARAAGFHGAGLRWAVAVALAESGGRTDATYTNHDRWHSVDRGLWQINNHWHPEVSDAQAFDPAQAAAAAYRISNGGANWTPWATFKNGKAHRQLGRAKLAAAAPAAQVGKAPKTPDVGSTGGGSTSGTTTPTTPAPAPAAPVTMEDAGFHLPSPLAGLPLGLGGEALLGLTDVNPLSGVAALGNAATQTAKLIAGVVTALLDPHTYVRAAYIGIGAGAVLTGAYLLAKSGTAGGAVASVAQGAGNTVKSGVKAAKLAAVA